MSESCCKKIFGSDIEAVIQATHDEEQYGDKRKVYYHHPCAGWHTSREKVHVNVPILKR